MVTTDLIERARATEWSALPADVVVHARHALLDWVGTTVAGMQEEVSTLVGGFVGDSRPADKSRILGTARMASARDAALVNGTAGHALDFDDVLLEATSHVTAVTMPAAFALSDEIDASGSDLLTAFIGGFETVGDLGAVMGKSHYAKGFHSTATLGVFGSASACAWLLGLNAEKWQSAFGLAATTSAGLKSMFGTMAKPLHAGWAAQAGVVAAELASRGVTAARDVIQRPQGFADAHGVVLEGAETIASHPGDWRIRRNLFKFHAACFLTHSGIDSAKFLRERHAIDPSHVHGVSIAVNPGHLSVCNIEWPATGAEAKFSLRYAVAAALDPRIDLSDAFTDGAVRRGQLDRLRPIIEVTADETLPQERSRVTVIDRNGERFMASVDSSQAAIDVDLASRERGLVAKFDMLVRPVYGAEQAERLSRMILTLDGSSRVRDLSELLAAPPASLRGGVA